MIHSFHNTNLTFTQSDTPLFITLFTTDKNYAPIRSQIIYKNRWLIIYVVLGSPFMSKITMKIILQLVYIWPGLFSREKRHDVAALHTLITLVLKITDITK